MKKTLILNGSPRENGDTAGLIKQLTLHLKGEYTTVSSYHGNISPCQDCRCCRKQPGCVLQDEMQEVYRLTENCDNILIASPVHFSELTGSLLSLCSRFQAYYCSRCFLNTEPVPKKKKGSILLVGGGDGDYATAEKTAKILLKTMGAEGDFPLAYSGNTDKVPAADDRTAMNEILKIADFFNED